MPKVGLRPPYPALFLTPMSISVLLSFRYKSLEITEAFSLNDEHLFLGYHGTSTSRSRTTVVSWEPSMSHVDSDLKFFHTTTSKWPSDNTTIKWSQCHLHVCINFASFPGSTRLWIVPECWPLLYQSCWSSMAVLGEFLLDFWEPVQAPTRPMVLSVDLRDFHKLPKRSSYSPFKYIYRMQSFLSQTFLRWNIQDRSLTWMIMFRRNMNFNFPHVNISVHSVRILKQMSLLVQRL